MLRLVRAWLDVGIMAGGVVIERHEGTPQGGPLSPLLANLLLDEVDRELERRGHCFVRYADDCNVYVGSQRAGERVMALLKRLDGRLKLRINEAKSAVASARWTGSASSWASRSTLLLEARSAARSRSSPCRPSSTRSGD